MKILFLDDLRPVPDYFVYMRPSPEITIARNFDEFKLAVDNDTFDEISFDHDLGDGKSGYDAITYLEWKIRMEKYPVPEMRCHSANPSGRARVESVINAIRLWEDMRKR